MLSDRTHWSCEGLEEAMPTWDEFDIVGESADDAGWTSLPPNGWGALVAFIAGPGRARGVRRTPRPVKVVTGRPGAEVTQTRPPTDDELDHVREAVTGYLSMSGIPEPPAGVEWQICLPDDTNERSLDRGVNRAMREADGLDFPGQREAVTRYISRLLAPDG